MSVASRVIIASGEMAILSIVPTGCAALYDGRVSRLIRAEQDRINKLRRVL